MIPKVSIIILNWDRLEDTIECLESLKKITYPNYEVIVVDNASKGNDADVLEEKYRGYIKLIRNRKNLGFAGGNNTGLRYSLNNLSDYSLILNNDVIVKENFLSEIVEVAEQKSEAGLLGPKIYYYDKPNIFYSTGGIIKRSFLKGIFVPLRGNKQEDKGQYDSIEEVDWIDGCCMLIKTKALEEVGLLNEEYFLYWDTVEMAMDLKKRGWKSYYVPRSVIWHKVQRTVGRKKVGVYYYQVKDQLIFQSKHLGSKFWLIYFPLKILKRTIYDFLISMRDKDFSRLKLLFRAYKDFFLLKLNVQKAEK